MNDLDALNDAVAVLTRRYPLPPGWSRPELFADVTRVSGVALHTAGLVSRAQDGREATGSAAETASYPIERAFFELIERVSVLDALVAARESYEALDLEGNPAGHVGRAMVFPAAPDDAAFRYSLSNGVALGLTFRDASRAARAELVERDRILRSWLGQTAPVQLDAPARLSGLTELYQFEARAVPAPAGSESDLEVAAIFGFPRAAEQPLLRGMGAGRTLGHALARASDEVLQSLGFLWGEPVPDTEPPLAPNAAYHQEFFLWSGAHARLRAWLGAREERSPELAPTSTPPRVRLVNITPQHLAGRVSVVKAIPGSELPLVFGTGHPSFRRAAAERVIHPIA